MVKKILFRFSIAIIFIFAMYYGYKLYLKYSVVEAEIEKVELTRGDINVMFNVIGEVEPENIVEVRSLVSGELINIFVKEGDKVKKGDKLAVVRPGQSEADKFMPVDILSPIDGTIFKCHGKNYYDEDEIKKVGERVSGMNEYSPTCIMQVADMSKMIVKLNVSETEVLKLKKNMPVKIKIETIKRELNGRVLSISPNAKSNGRMEIKTFPVKVAIDEEVHILSGMTARVTAVLEIKKNVLLMPLSGLFEEKGRYYVYLYNEKTNKAKKVYVDVGIRNEMEVEIKSGLKEGDKVYTDKPLNIENDKNSKS